MIPHDYYHDEESPVFGCKGHSLPYLDDDWLACNHDGVLPIVSTIGKGPRGEGLEVEAVTGDDGSYSIVIKSDETGEVVLETPDLSAPKISISAVPEDPAPGETVKMTISVSQGGSKTDYVVEVPSGADGTRIYVSSEPAEENDSGIHEVDEGSLAGHDVPRINDLVISEVEGIDGACIAIGHLLALENGKAVWKIDARFRCGACGSGAGYIFPTDAPDVVEDIDTIGELAQRINDVIAGLVKANVMNSETVEALPLPNVDIAALEAKLEEMRRVLSVVNPDAAADWPYTEDIEDLRDEVNLLIEAFTEAECFV